MRTLFGRIRNVFVWFFNVPCKFVNLVRARAATNTDKGKRDENYTKLYVWGDALALTIKTLLQMSIGFVLVCLLILKAFFELFWFHHGLSVLPILQLHALQLVSHGLAYSAGVELCYMLYTPGPDEALEPVILGLASYILYVISGGISDGTSDGISKLLSVALEALLIAISALSIGFLFYVRHEFIKK